MSDVMMHENAVIFKACSGVIKADSVLVKIAHGLFIIPLEHGEYIQSLKFEKQRLEGGHPCAFFVLKSY